MLCVENKCILYRLYILVVDDRPPSPQAGGGAQNGWHVQSPDGCWKNVVRIIAQKVTRDCLQSWRRLKFVV